MGKSWIKRSIAIAAAALVLGTAGVTADDSSNPMQVFQSGFRGAQVTGTAVSDLANITKVALDSDPGQRSAPVPSTGYAAKIQQEYIKDRGAQDNAPVAALSRNLVETTDPRLLADPDFRTNLRDLFELQAADSLAPEKLNDNRVIGGSPIPAATDVVSIIDRSNGNFRQICSGIVIDATHVLTAAHCVCLGVNKRVQTGQDVVIDNPAAAFLVKSSQLMPGIKCPVLDTDGGLDKNESAIGQAVAGYDLAVLEVTRPIASNLAKPDKLLGPAGFTAWRASAQRKFVRVGGFGFNKLSVIGEADPDSYGTLNFADLAIPATACRAQDVEQFHCVLGRDMLAATNPNMNVHSTINTNAGPADTCNGDSGGPAYAQVADPGGKLNFYPVAMTSRAATSHGCGSGSVYTLLDSKDVRDWLQNKAKFTD